MKVRKQGYATYSCEYHIVISSKYSRKILNTESYEYFKKVLDEILEVKEEITAITVSYGEEYIHMHLSIPPKIRVSDVVKKIKSISSSLIKKKFEHIKRAYSRTGIWSDGYLVTTLEIDEKVIKKYVEQQGQEDRGLLEF